MTTVILAILFYYICFFSRVSIQYFGSFFQKADDRKMLRAYSFTLAATDTVGSLSVSFHKAFVEVLAPPVIRISSEGIDSPEDIGNADILRASRCAVLAGSTADLRNTQDLFCNLIDNSLLLRSYGLKIRKGLDIVKDLLLIGHTGKNCHYSGK